MGGKNSLAIVLAAGEGSRMRSSLPKVMHRVAGRSLLAHVMATVTQADFAAAAVVIGPDHDLIRTELRRIAPAAEVYVQRERLGTAHAVLSAEAAIAHGFDEVVVLFGDTPFVRPQTLDRLRGAVGGDVAVAVLGFRPADPTGYGRLIIQDGNLVAIREESDASPAERRIGLCNAGLMALKGDIALGILRQIGNGNAKSEFYLTDAVAGAAAAGLGAVALEAEEDEVRGINDRSQLTEAETALQQRLRKQALDAGVTLVAPETVFFSADTRLERDVTVEPYVVFGPGVIIEEGAIIHSFSYMEGAHIGRGASIGPFARLRPGTRLGERVKIGNFVELKGTEMEAGAKANHLSYIGDTHVGAAANIGAGTITCNYDGFGKHRTEIGAGAFIGSNTALVAPVKVGDGSYIGSGSVITTDVPDGALAIGRGRQTNKEGWAQRLRARLTRDKKTAAE